MDAAPSCRTLLCWCVSADCWGMLLLVRIWSWIDEWQQACARHTASSSSSSSLPFSSSLIGQQMEWVLGWLSWRFKGVITFQLVLLGPFWVCVFVYMHMWGRSTVTMKLGQVLILCCNYAESVTVLLLWFVWFNFFILVKHCIMSSCNEHLEREKKSEWCVCVCVTVGRGAGSSCWLHNSLQWQATCGSEWL